MGNSLRLTYSKNLEMERSELDLINESKQNPRAFEPLYKKYFDQLYSFIFYRVNDADTAKEITSQVFLKALSKIHQFQYKGLPFSSWLYRIAINECNIHYRSSKHSRIVVLDEKTIDYLTSEMGTSTIFDEDLFQQLELVIQKLKPEQVQLVQLRFFDELSFKEIGQILDVTENNAKVKLYRVLDKIRSKMNVQ
ncbi:RNA polymerase sigma factor [Fulvivirga ligni]|uniref:RNA polymerase sigma factor n=1 Tax=Fulvivirga ligni TaxID=2904246 RepID=UPI001F1D18CF|nr:RNA polymerase sigma factor [Fulvivirga ligni]UII23813.1 RNA polymerase sigma factor [Fulvivirga ligni]